MYRLLLSSITDKKCSIFGVAIHFKEQRPLLSFHTSLIAILGLSDELRNLTTTWFDLPSLSNILLKVCV